MSSGVVSPGQFEEQPGKVPANLSAEALWGLLTSDPQTGVAIVTIDGTVIYSNDQAARIFFGAAATGAQYAGADLKKLLPPEWIEERIKVLHQVLITGKPVALRTIWKGVQQVSWIRYLEHEDPDGEGDGVRDLPSRFLVITRQVPGEESPEKLVDESRFEFVESQVIELGALEELTPRELEVLALIGQGLSLKEIAQRLFRTVKTIEKHRAAIGEKLAAHDRVHLAELARRAGLTLRDAARERV